MINQIDHEGIREIRNKVGHHLDANAKLKTFAGTQNENLDTPGPNYPLGPGRALCWRRIECTHLFVLARKECGGIDPANTQETPRADLCRLAALVTQISELPAFFFAPELLSVA